MLLVLHVWRCHCLALAQPPLPADSCLCCVAVVVAAPTPAVDNDTLIQFVWRLTGGDGQPVLPISALE